MENMDNQGLVFDLSNVEEQQGFELLPKGKYPAIVDEMDFSESQAGNPMIATKYKVVEGEHEGRVLFDYWVLTGNGAEFGQAKLKKFLVRVCPEVDLSAFNPADFCEEGVAIGRECLLDVAIQTQKKGDYKGEKRNTIRDVLAPEGSDFL